jgi:signal transduction histidine kinase
MDRMTIRGEALIRNPLSRWLAYWPAFLVPLIAAGTVGLIGSPIPQILIVLAIVLAVAAPAETAKVAHLPLLGYGAYGLFKLHSLEIYESTPVHYGLVTAARLITAIPGGFQLTPRTVGFAPMLAEAMAFLIAGLCVLAVTCAPGGRVVRRAIAQLRGSDGEPKTVPPLLLIPVLFLWEELFSAQLWFGSGWQNPGRALAIMIFAVGAALVFGRPRTAAIAAVAGMVIFGIVGVLAAIRWAIMSGTENPSFGAPMFYGATLLNGGLNLLAVIQGTALAGLGCVLASRLLTRTGDADLAKRAEALTQRVGRLTRTRSDAAEVAVAELRRIERDLHDGAQARLVAVGMSLRAAEELMRADPEAARTLVAEARETSSRALDDLRGLVRGIYPPVLADRGLADAVRALALDAPVTADTDVTLQGEPPMPVAAAVYFGIAEALTNAARHSGAGTVQIGIGYAGGLLRATITDDGEGGADPSRGTGLAGVERRLATFDGILAVSSPPGGPTIVVLEVPCVLSAQEPGSSTRSSWQTIT